MNVISSKTLFILLTVCLLVAGVAVYAVAAKEDGAGAAEDGEAGTTQEVAGATGEGAEGTGVPTQDTESHAMLAFDPTDERQLVGESEDAFFGRVVEQVGSEPIITSGAGNAIPQAQFSVEVLETIKGDASGTVTVNQEFVGGDDGHKDHKHHKHRRGFEGDQLLVPGEEYLFYTNYDERRGWHVLSVPVAASHVKIDSEEKRSKEREEARRAKENQIKADPDADQTPVEPGAGRPCLPDASSPTDKPCDPSAPLPSKDKGSGKAKETPTK